MNKIVDFSEYVNNAASGSVIIKFGDSVPENDTFLHLTTFNALQAFGYDVSTDGVKKFQANNGLDSTGVIELKDIIVLAQAFNEDHRQDIFNYIKDIKDKNAKKKKKLGINLILGLLIMLFFEIWGVASFWNTVLWPMLKFIFCTRI